MSMSFEQPLTEGQQEMMADFMRDSLVAQDEHNTLFQDFDIKQEEMSALANKLEQPVTVEIHGEGDIKTMTDGTKYQVGKNGWKKLDPTDI